METRQSIALAQEELMLIGWQYEQIQRTLRTVPMDAPMLAHLRRELEQVQTRVGGVISMLSPVETGDYLTTTDLRA